MKTLETLTYKQIKEVKSIVLHIINDMSPNSSLKERESAQLLAKPIFDAFNKAYNKENGIDN